MATHSLSRHTTLPSSLTCRPGLQRSLTRWPYSAVCVISRGITQTSQARATAALDPVAKKPLRDERTQSTLSRVSTANLLRSLLLGYCFSSPRLLNFSLRLMGNVVHSKSAFLHPDKNPIIGVILRALIYDHFCAGTSAREVRQSIERTKAIGYSGIILGFSREIVVEDVGTGDNPEVERGAITSWMNANLNTLKLIGPGDHMNLKFTGAGDGTSKALLDGAPPPEDLVTAFDTICEQARAQGSSVWIDAEEQPYQPTVNDWAISFMRRWNLNGQSVVYNTVQAYLKSSRDDVVKQLRAAQGEEWTCAIKLVRGAYIQCDIRDRIWDTKRETDENYNSIVHDLLTKNFGPIKKEEFPKLNLFIAGHNKESVRLATQLVSDLIAKGENIGPVQYGQLQGMADEVSCQLVHRKIAMSDVRGLSEQEKDRQHRATPQPYKCLIWGSVNDCLHFLMRRAVENATAAERLKDGLIEVKRELRRRLFFG